MYVSSYSFFKRNTISQGMTTTKMRIFCVDETWGVCVGGRENANYRKKSQICAIFMTLSSTLKDKKANLGSGKKTWGGGVFRPSRKDIICILVFCKDP